MSDAVFEELYVDLQDDLEGTQLSYVNDVEWFKKRLLRLCAEYASRTKLEPWEWDNIVVRMPKTVIGTFKLVPLEDVSS